VTAVISSPAYWKLASLSRALKPDEVERLLNSSPPIFGHSSVATPSCAALLRNRTTHAQRHWLASWSGRAEV